MRTLYRFDLVRGAGVMEKNDRDGEVVTEFPRIALKSLDGMLVAELPDATACSRIPRDT